MVFRLNSGYLLGGTPLGVVYWYTYDDMGNPIFMLGNGVPDGQPGGDHILHHPLV